VARLGWTELRLGRRLGGKRNTISVSHRTFIYILIVVQILSSLSAAIGDPSPAVKAVDTKFRWVSGFADAEFGQ
jgi:hypothetical protein